MKKYLFTAVAALSLLAVPAAALAAAYKDVPAGHWASKTIEWGTTQHVVTGYPNGTFKPENSVTEEEFLTMLVSAYVNRSDLQGAATYWSDPFYYFAHDHNYPTEGWDEPTARQWKINRQRVAEIVSGATGMNYSGDNAIKWLLAKGLAKGKSADVSVVGYKGGDFLTRAEAVQFIKNAKENGLTELKVRPAQPSDPAAIPPLPGQGSGQIPGGTEQQPGQQPTTPGQGQTPGQTPGQTQNPSTPPGGNVQPGSGTTIKVVPSTTPSLLLPKDAISESAIQSFLDSLSFDKSTSTVKGKIPTNLPKGYTFTLDFDTNGKGTRLKLKEGEAFELHVAGKDSGLFFALAVYPQLKNCVSVNLPAMTAEWGTKR